MALNSPRLRELRMWLEFLCTTVKLFAAAKTWLNTLPSTLDGDIYEAKGDWMAQAGRRVRQEPRNRLLRVVGHSDDAPSVVLVGAHRPRPVRTHDGAAGRLPSGKETQGVLEEPGVSQNDGLGGHASALQFRQPRLVVDMN